jgi:hypothetical protein
MNLVPLQKKFTLTQSFQPSMFYLHFCLSFGFFTSLTWIWRSTNYVDYWIISHRNLEGFCKFLMTSPLSRSLFQWTIKWFKKMWVKYFHQFDKCFKNHVIFFIVIKVACANGLSVNTLKAQLIVPSKPNFYIFFEFLPTKSIQKSISSTF